MQATAYTPPPIPLETRLPERPRRSKRWPGLAISMAVHVGLFAAGWLYLKRDAFRSSPQTVIAAKLVQVGKPRDEKLLPRLEPRAAADSAVAVGPASPSTADPAATKVNEALERQKRMMDALAKLNPSAGDSETAKRALEREGREEGAEQGDATRAEEGDVYSAVVVKTLKDNFVVPTTISPQERVSLFCELLLFVAADGRVMRYEIETSSGNPQFDRAVEATLMKAQFPAPPESLRSTYEDDGLPVRFKP